jgi:hypothetical protein
MTIHWKVLEEHFLMVPFFDTTNSWGKMHFLDFSHNTSVKLSYWHWNHKWARNMTKNMANKFRHNPNELAISCPPPTILLVFLSNTQMMKHYVRVQHYYSLIIVLFARWSETTCGQLLLNGMEKFGLIVVWHGTVTLLIQPVANSMLSGVCINTLFVCIDSKYGIQICSFTYTRKSDRLVPDQHSSGCDACDSPASIGRLFCSVVNIREIDYFVLPRLGV